MSALAGGGTDERSPASNEDMDNTEERVSAALKMLVDHYGWPREQQPLCDMTPWCMGGLCCPRCGCLADQHLGAGCVEGRREGWGAAPASC